jgi:hypothetical protein
MPTLTPAREFDWSKVTWGRPDSVPSVLCSYCSASISEDEVPLILWDKRSFAAKFCKRCMQKWWGFR